MMKNIFYFLVLLLFASSKLVGQETNASETYAGGDGTLESPFQISNLAELRKLSETKEDWDKHYVLTQNIDAYQTKEWNSGKGFSPIGESTKPFKGSINGKGFEIKGLYIYEYQASYLGFIGHSSASRIDSLGIVDFNYVGYRIIGGIIGKHDNPDFVMNACYSSGRTIGCYPTNSQCAGLIGGMWNGTVKNSHSLFQFQNNYQGSEENGGLIGKAGYKAKVTIDNCHTVYTVTGSSVRFTGGLVGEVIDANITNSSSTASIYNSNGNIRCVGGLIGQIDKGSVVNCYANGEVMCKDKVGGLIGYSLKDVEVRNCISNTKVQYWGYNDEIGGMVIGSNESDNIHKLFYNMAYSKDGEIHGIGSYAGHPHVKGLSIEEFADSTKFLAFDFDSLWHMRTEFASEYKQPYLQSNASLFNKEVTVRLVKKTPYGTIGESDTVITKVVLGTEVQVKAEPFTGYKLRWEYLDENAAYSSVSYGKVLANRDQTLVANFEAKEYDLDVYVHDDFKFGKIVDTAGQVVDKVKLDNLLYVDSVEIKTQPTDTSYKCFGFSNGKYFEQFGDNILFTDGKDGERYSFDAIFAKKNINDTTPNYLVGVMYGANGSTTKETGVYAKGANYYITAKPWNKYRLGKWEDEKGNFISEKTSLSFKVDSDVALMPVFVSDTLNRVVFQVKDTAMGTLIGEPCQFVANNDSTFEVKAQAKPGYEFVRWETAQGDSISAEANLILRDITKDYYLVATFKLSAIELKLKSTENGYITLGNKTTQDTSIQISINTELPEIKAIANEHYIFKNWQKEDGSEYSTSATLAASDIKESITLTATFEIQEYSVTISAGTNGTIRIADTLVQDTVIKLAYGSTLPQLEALANDKYKFKHWQTASGEVYSTENPLTNITVEGDMNLSAAFDVVESVNDISNKLSIYPSVSNGSYTFENNSGLPAKISILSTSGKLINTSVVTSNVSTLSIPGANGMYFISISINGYNKQTVKVIKQ